MKALTLKQPWAWAVVDAGKWIENRSWTPPHALLGQRFAIHAGLKKLDRFDLVAALAHAINTGWDGTSPQEWVCGCIVGTATLSGYVRSEDGESVSECVLVGAERRAATAAAERALRSPWFIGPVGFFLADVRPLKEPVPCKGALSFWEVPRELERTIRDRAASRRRGRS